MHAQKIKQPYKTANKKRIIIILIMIKSKVITKESMVIKKFKGGFKHVHGKNLHLLYKRFQWSEQDVIRFDEKAADIQWVNNQIIKLKALMKTTGSIPRPNDLEKYDEII